MQRERERGRERKTDTDSGRPPNPQFRTNAVEAQGRMLADALACRRASWRHNKFWINWLPPDHPSLPDEHVVNTHKVVTTMMAQIALDAYENTTYKADPIRCVDCTKAWGWACCHESPFGRAPIDKFACCNKDT
eukprot:1764835-Pleurochrysis_carterae.AAC.1